MPTAHTHRNDTASRTLPAHTGRERKLPRFAFDSITVPQMHWSSSWGEFMRRQVLARQSGEDGYSLKEAAEIHATVSRFLQLAWDRFAHDKFERNLPDPSQSRTFAAKVFADTVSKDREQVLKAFLDEHPFKIPEATAEHYVRNIFYSVLDGRPAAGSKQGVKQASRAALLTPQESERTVAEGKRVDRVISEPSKSLDRRHEADFLRRYSKAMGEESSGEGASLARYSKRVAVASHFAEYLAKKVDEESKGVRCSAGERNRKIAEKAFKGQVSETIADYLKQFESDENDHRYHYHKSMLLRSFYPWARSEKLTEYRSYADALYREADAPVGEYYRDVWEQLAERVELHERSRGRNPKGLAEQKALQAGRGFKALVEWTYLKNRAHVDAASDREKALAEALFSDVRANTLAYLDDRFPEGPVPEGWYLRTWHELHMYCFPPLFEKGEMDYNPHIGVFISPSCRVSHPAISWWAAQVAQMVNRPLSKEEALEHRAGTVRARAVTRFFEYLYDSSYARELSEADDRSDPAVQEQVLAVLLQSDPEEYITRFVEAIRNQRESERLATMFENLLRQEFFPKAFAEGLVEFDLARASYHRQFRQPGMPSLYGRWVDATFEDLRAEGSELSSTRATIRIRSAAEFIRELLDEERQLGHYDSESNEDLIFERALTRHGGMRQAVSTFLERALQRSKLETKMNKQPALELEFLPWFEQKLFSGAGAIDLAFAAFPERQQVPPTQSGEGVEVKYVQVENSRFASFLDLRRRAIVLLAYELNWPSEAIADLQVRDLIFSEPPQDSVVLFRPEGAKPERTPVLQERAMRLQPAQAELLLNFTKERSYVFRMLGEKAQERTLPVFVKLSLEDKDSSWVSAYAPRTVSALPIESIDAVIGEFLDSDHGQSGAGVPRM